MTATHTGDEQDEKPFTTTKVKLTDGCLRAIGMSSRASSGDARIEEELTFLSILSSP